MDYHRSKVNEKATIKETEDEREEVKDVKAKTEIREFYQHFSNRIQPQRQKNWHMYLRIQKLKV